MNRKEKLLSFFLIISASSVFFLYLASFKILASMGHFIQQDNMLEDYGIGVIWAFLLGFSLFLIPFHSFDKNHLLIIWFLRCLVTLIVMLFYENNYALDAYLYFDFSRGDNPGFLWGNGFQNICLITYFHNKIFPDSYHMMKVSFSMIGFISCYIIYRAFVRFIAKECISVLYIVSLFPSVLFWSSILGKDPIVFLGISIYIYGIIAYGHLNSLRYMILIFIGIVNASTIRIWMAPILITPLAVLIIYRLKSKLTKVVLVAFVFLLFFSTFDSLKNRFEIENREDFFVATNRVAHAWAGKGGSGIQQEINFRDIRSILTFLPLGMFTALFRPLPGEVNNIFGIIAGLENLTVLLLLIRGILRIRRSDLLKPIIVSGFVFTIVWSSIYGIVSYQNLGTAVRFKLQVLPVLLGLLLYLNRR